MRILLSAISIFLLTACSKGENMDVINEEPVVVQPTVKTYSYLALGDSYTIGESVKQEESFPFQLTAMLNMSTKIQVSSPKVIATTGWTTSELQGAIKNANLQEKYGMVTLLIGVNNQYRGQSQETYRKEFKELLQTAIAFADNKKERVFVVSIPDWGFTPFGKKSGRNQATITAEINAFNAINQEETLAMGLSYTNITPASRKVGADLTLAASDGLHPSGRMYTEWANALKEPVLKQLEAAAIE